MNPENPVIAISISLLGRARPFAHDPYILVVTDYSKIKKYNLTNKKLLNYELNPFRNTISQFKHFIRLNIQSIDKLYNILLNLILKNFWSHLRRMKNLIIPLIISNTLLTFLLNTCRTYLRTIKFINFLIYYIFIIWYIFL